MGWSEFIR